MEIKEHMRDIPQSCDPAPIIRIYVDLNLQTLQKAGIISGPLPDADAPPAAPQPEVLPTSSAPVANGNTVPVRQMPSSNSNPSMQDEQPAQERRQPTASTSVSANPSPSSSAGSLTSPGSQVSKHEQKQTEPFTPYSHCA